MIKSKSTLKTTIQSRYKIKFNENTNHS